MEHMLLTPQKITFSKQGIPYRLIYHLLKGSRAGGHCFHDANLISNYGSGTDQDLTEINALEQKLGRLSPEQMDLRVMADFCCIWRYDYPKRVTMICAAIGGNLHRALRLHYQICPQRRQELINHALALKGWLDDREPEDKEFFSDVSVQTAVKVFQFLGKKDPVKNLLVERTYLGLSKRYLNCSYWGYNAAEQEVSLAPYTAQDLPGNWPEKMSKLERLIQQGFGPEAQDFLCEVGGAAEPACHFKFIRRIDILLSSIGCLRWRGNLPPKNNTIRGRRQITAGILHVLEKYWRGASAGINSAAGDVFEGELCEALGEQTDFKRWLVACLWKNIKNQTTFHAFPMKRWVEFVRIGEDYIKAMTTGKR